MNEELIQHIVDDLGGQRSRNDIVQMVCEEGGLEWHVAEQLVQQVETEHAHMVARKQVPVMVFLSAGTMGVGLLLVSYCIQVLAEALHGSPLRQILALADSYIPLVMGVVGLGMISGGIIGMWRTLLRYFET